MLKNHLKRVFIGLIIGLIGGVLYWQFAPKVYDSLGIVYINSDTGPTMTKDESGEEVSRLLGMGGTQNVISEIDMLRSEQLYSKALSDVADDYHINGDPYAKDQAAGGDALRDLLKTKDMEQRLFPMYDVEADKDSHVATVDVKALRQDIAIALVKKIVRDYDDIRYQNQLQAQQKAHDYLTTNLATTNKQLSDLESTLAKYKANKELITPSEDENRLASARLKLEQDYSGAKMELAVLAKQTDAQKKEYAVRPPTQITNISLEKNPTLTSDEAKLSQLEQERAAMLVQYQPTSDKVKQVDQTIAALKSVYVKDQADQFKLVGKSETQDKVHAELDEALAMADVSKKTLDSRVAAIQAQLAENKTAARLYPGEEMYQTQLMRERETKVEEVQKLRHELDDMDLKLGGEPEAATISGGEPFHNDLPVSPQAMKAIPTGAALGACLLLLVSLAIEALRSTVRTSSELTGVLGLPVTATVPALKAREAQRRMRTLAEPTFVPLESFRFMASAAALTVDTCHRVLFTGIGGNVGCSTSAAEFAVASSKMGVKTILVDADLAATTASRAFGVSGKPGIRDIINHTLLPGGDGTLVQPTEHKNLSILPAGSAEGLGISDVPSAQLAAVLESLAPLAQLIIIDCPPFDVLADASRFVPYVDEACLVVSAKKTHLQSIMIVEKLIQRAGAHTVSIVLTETGTPEEAFSKRGYRYRKAS